MLFFVLSLIGFAGFVGGSPATDGWTEGAFDEDCFKDDLRKVCGLDDEAACREECGKELQCSAYVYNYKVGPSPKWDDGCCWLKSGCSNVKPMTGKRRVVVRLSTLALSTPTDLSKALDTHLQAPQTTATALSSFKEQTATSTDTMAASIQRWTADLPARKAKRAAEAARLAKLRPEDTKLVPLWPKM